VCGDISFKSIKLSFIAKRKIGFQIAKDLLLLGASVVICSRKADLLEEAKEALSAFGKVGAFPCDIRQEEDIAALAAYIKKQFERLDILVNNAGGQFPALAENINNKGWNAVINNNLNGTFFMTRDMANQFFIPQKEGIIVNIIAEIHRGFPGMIHTGAARTWHNRKFRIENVSSPNAEYV